MGYTTVSGYSSFLDQWDEFPSAEDWDNEEYTGSLAESKVFTPSTQPQSTTGVSSAPTETVSGGLVPSSLQTDTTSNGLSTNHIGKGGSDFGLRFREVA